MAYTSKHGKAEDKGNALGSSVSGNGQLPCGSYTVTVIGCSKEGHITIEDETGGTHVEVVDMLPEWVRVGDKLAVVVGMTDGVYARTKQGKIALYDAKSHTNITGWLDNLDEVAHMNRKFTPASPTITEIKKKHKGANLVWRNGA